MGRRDASHFRNPLRNFDSKRKHSRPAKGANNDKEKEEKEVESIDITQTRVTLGEGRFLTMFEASYLRVKPD